MEVYILSNFRNIKNNLGKTERNMPLYRAKDGFAKLWKRLSATS